jgi:uncharacterized membrane protein
MHPKTYMKISDKVIAIPAAVRPVLKAAKPARIESIDLLRGIVMIIMAIDHVRDYFHHDAFVYSPTDLSKTTVVLFFTRWITHFCAPVFCFLAGVSALLYGKKRTKKQLSFFLLTRGLWLVFIEMIVLNFFKTFDPTLHFINLQVIWSLGTCMMALAAIVYMPRNLMLALGLLLVFGHNLLDPIHVTGGGSLAIFWSILHEPGYYTIGGHIVYVFYPILPWLGVMVLGYYFGTFFSSEYEQAKRKKVLLYTGIGALVCFVLLRSFNIYGDASLWSAQKNAVFSFLSFLNVTKYPPSLLYILVTLGSALIFLALAEKPLNKLTSKISVFGRVPMFYYLCHFLLIHSIMVIAAMLDGYKFSDLILTDRVNNMPALKNYGYSLPFVYLVWISVIVLLYPLSRWYDKYKRANLAKKPWLSYI